MINKELIAKEIYIEELVEKYPDSIDYLMKKGIRCLVCGEPIWGTLETAAKEKGFSEKEIQLFVNELNSLLSKK